MFSGNAVQFWRQKQQQSKRTSRETERKIDFWAIIFLRFVYGSYCQIRTFAFQFSHCMLRLKSKLVHVIFDSWVKFPAAAAIDAHWVRSLYPPIVKEVANHSAIRMES